MEQSPSWEANRFSTTQEILRILCNLKVHYRINKSPPPVPILSHIEPVHAHHATSLRSILILFFHLRLGLSNVLFPSGFPLNPSCTSHLPHMCHIPSPPQSQLWLQLLPKQIPLFSLIVPDELNLLKMCHVPSSATFSVLLDIPPVQYVYVQYHY